MGFSSAAELSFETPQPLLPVMFSKWKSGCSQKGNCLHQGFSTNLPRKLSLRGSFHGPSKKGIVERKLSLIEEMPYFTLGKSGWNLVVNLFGGHLSL